MSLGLDWYKREPAAYLKDVQGLSAKEHAVYSVILDLIYTHGGSVNNDPRWISGWISDMGAAAVRTAISSLVERGILTVDGDQLTQKRAKSEAKLKRNQRKTAQENGRIGGERSAEIRRANKENNDLGEAGASSDTQAEKRREEKSKKEEGKPSSKKDTRGSRLPDNWNLPLSWGMWAVEEEGLPHEVVRRQGEKFRDYWHSVSGSKGVKRDWEATWRNWIRKAADETPKSQPQRKERTDGSALSERIAARFGEMDQRADRNPPLPLLQTGSGA